VPSPVLWLVSSRFVACSFRRSSCGPVRRRPRRSRRSLGSVSTFILAMRGIGRSGRGSRSVGTRQVGFAEVLQMEGRKKLLVFIDGHQIFRAVISSFQPGRSIRLSRQSPRRLPNGAERDGTGSDHFDGRLATGVPKSSQDLLVLGGALVRTRTCLVISLADGLGRQGNVADVERSREEVEA
jgi:hypothetical protein